MFSVKRLVTRLGSLVILIALVSLVLPVGGVNAAEDYSEQSTLANLNSQSAAWTVEFFNNMTWTGPAVAVGSVSSLPLAQDWGTNSPAPNVPVDGWTSRFTRVVNFPTGGLIVFEARADDTMTVWVDGVPVTASHQYFTGVTYRGQIVLTPGNHTIRVDHKDISAQAYLFVTWTGASGSNPPPSTGVTGRVTASLLNLRSAPVVANNRIGTLAGGQTYNIVGRNAASNWAYVDANGVKGWASTAWLAISGNFGGLPVVDGSQTNPPPATGVRGAPTTDMRIRSCPSIECSRLGVVPRGVAVSVLGQNFTGDWIKIQYTAPGINITGWSFKANYRDANNLTLFLPANLPVVQ